jgi:uroporphyrinogen decarboxylase
MREPNFENILKVLRREKTERPTLFEFIIDLKFLISFSGMQVDIDKIGIEFFRMVIEGYRKAGYDYVSLFSSKMDTLRFETGEVNSIHSKSQNEGWLINDWESFEKYQWPEIDKINYEWFEKIEKELPEGMKFMACSNGGVLENTIEIVGFENLCMLSLMDEELTKLIFDSVGSRLLAYYETISRMDHIGILMVNDDWGFNIQTVLSPEAMRKFVTPWHKEIVKTIHDAGKPAVLHSCGNVKELMEDIIDAIGFDGKHSFEDNIYPVEQAYEWWGDRIAILGGIDVDFLASKSPEDIRKRAKEILELTADRGGYALGSGNSIPDYIPEENFRAMIGVIH